MHRLVDHKYSDTLLGHRPGEFPEDITYYGIWQLATTAMPPPGVLRVVYSSKKTASKKRGLEHSGNVVRQGQLEDAWASAKATTTGQDDKSQEPPDGTLAATPKQRQPRGQAAASASSASQVCPPPLGASPPGHQTTKQDEQSEEPDEAPATNKCMG